MDKASTAWVVGHAVRGIVSEAVHAKQASENLRALTLLTTVSSGGTCIGLLAGIRDSGRTLSRKTAAIALCMLTLGVSAVATGYLAHRHEESIGALRMSCEIIAGTMRMAMTRT